MKQELHDHDGYDELTRLVYHDDKRAVNSFCKRLSDDTDQDAFDALAADGRYMLHIDWNGTDYVSIVSDVRKLKQCSGLAVKWNDLKKLALWLGDQEREAGDYWSISFVKIVASVLANHGLDVLLIRDSSDPDWIALAALQHESTHLVEKLFSRLFDDLDITWGVASKDDWDSPEDVAKEIRRRLAAIATER
ncbi:MAG: hypothetical protein V4567_01965 [Pseudomonadota bacterium]